MKPNSREGKNFLPEFWKMAESRVPLDSIELPSFSLVWKDGKILSQSTNRVEEKKDPTLHSELLCIQDALSLEEGKYLVDSILFTVLEPCILCAGAILKSKIPLVLYSVPAKPGEGISDLGWETIYQVNHFPILEYHPNPYWRERFREFFHEKRLFSKPRFEKHG